MSEHTTMSEIVVYWSEGIEGDELGEIGAGWFWQASLPGCFWEPNGPFATRGEALADAQNCDY